MAVAWALQCSHFGASVKYLVRNTHFLAIIGHTNSDNYCKDEEFRQATSHVEALEARLALLQQSIADSTANGALEESFSFILSKLTQLTQQHATRQQEEAAREKEANEAQRAAELAKEQEKERLLHEAQEREAERQQEEQKRIQALAVAAQKKRDSVRRSGLRGTPATAGGTGARTLERTLFRQSLQKLLAVVSNICKSPENAAFRHIPKDNTHFHADLGQYPGGHQCLFAMGFKELQQGDETQPRTVFVLEEPDLSEDLDAWSTWFEELKELQSLVESKAVMEQKTTSLRCTITCFGSYLV
ncbi:PUB domain [Phytophthora cactorum]|nr:PUB domain [Phytophthora cactorum]